MLPQFKKSTIILGVVTVARSRIETVEEIKKRVEEALKYIDSERLVLAPDCGLGFLTEDMITQKITNMVEAAKSFWMHTKQTSFFSSNVYHYELATTRIKHNGKESYENFANKL